MPSTRSSSLWWIPGLCSGYRGGGVGGGAYSVSGKLGCVVAVGAWGSWGTERKGREDQCSWRVLGPVRRAGGRRATREVVV